MNAISTATKPAPAFVAHRGGSPQQFEDVVGQFDKEVVLSGGNQEPHARFDMDVNGGTWEADINVHSIKNPDGSPGGSDVEYATKDEVVPSMPSEGVHSGEQFSYANEGLTEADFQTVSDDQLHQQLEQLARQSSRIELMGQVYHDGPGQDGIHDIHMNSGENNPKQDHPGQDGVARFYYQQDGQIHRETVFIKFQSQHLPGGQGGGNDLGTA